MTGKAEINIHIDTRSIMKLLKMLMQNIQVLTVDETIILRESSDCFVRLFLL
jgi:hypothetical protein